MPEPVKVQSDKLVQVFNVCYSTSDQIQVKIKTKIVKSIQIIISLHKSLIKSNNFQFTKFFK